MADYDVSKAYKRIENELIDSMIRNFKRHRVDEMKEGFTWEQWQVLQLRELEKYRLANPKKFAGDFSEIEKRAGDALMTTYTDAKSAEEAKILQQIKKGKIRQTRGSGTVAGKFFGLNAGRVEHLIEATKADFGRGSWSMLRQANDQYRKIIFDAQMYSATGATYEQAVDMATKDFLKNGIQSIVYKNGSHHGMEEYSRMALKTGQKRAYLMGEGDVHDKYGIHTVRVNKRVDACPLCVKWLGKVLVDDVYAGGTLEEAQQAKVPLLSEAIDEGFLHPNCKDVYSMYVEGISQPAEPWTKEEMQDIADRYNSEQALKRAEDMRDSYERMAKNSLDPANVDRYKARADAWQSRVDTINAGLPATAMIATPQAPPAPVYPTYTMADGNTATTKPLAKPATGKAVPFSKKLNPSFEDYKAHIAELEKAKTADAVMKPLYEKAIIEAEKTIADMKASGGNKGKLLTIYNQKKKYATKIQVMDLKDELKPLETALSGLKSDVANYELINDAGFQNIWKDVAYLSEYDKYLPKIQSKIDYFIDKIDEWTTKGLSYGKTQAEVDAKVAELTKQLDTAHEFEAEAIKYKAEYEKLVADLKKAEDAVEAKKDEILKLEKPKEWKKKHGQGGAITQDRRDKAVWAQTQKEADDVLRTSAGDAWINAPFVQQEAIYEYTMSYHKYNEPLRGIEYGTNRKLGVGKTDLNAGWANNGKRLNAMTEMIENSPTPVDMWFQRGCHWSGMDDFFGVSEYLLRHGTQQELEQALLGKPCTEWGFMSMGTSKGKGFAHCEIILNIFAPQGTKAIYVEPFSHYGAELHERGWGSGLHWDGKKKQTHFGDELETIAQQGTKMVVTKVERANGKLYVDLDIIGTEPPQLYK